MDQKSDELFVTNATVGLVGPHPAPAIANTSPHHTLLMAFAPRSGQRRSQKIPQVIARLFGAAATTHSDAERRTAATPFDTEGN
jgi:hypothetical protein